jgi:TP901 family phage tail tape measure protein
MVKTQDELQKINDELDKSNNKWLNASNSLNNASEKMKGIGSKISGAGNAILTMTAPLIAGGIASLKFSSDFENSMSAVSTISDDTQVPLGELGKQILKLSDDTGIASTDIAQNVYDAISAGQKTGDAVNFVTNSTKLAKAGFAEAGQSLDLLTTILNAYGMEAKEVNNVSDILVTTQNVGKTTVGQLSESMGKVIPTAKAFGVNLNQVASAYGLMTLNGIATSEAGTYVASMLNELGKGGTLASTTLKKLSGKTFQELIESGKSLGDILTIMDEGAKKDGKSLIDLFGSAEAGKAGLVLSANAGKDFNDVLGQMANSAGATDTAFEKVSNTTGERFNKSINKIKNDAIKFGDVISPLLDKLSGLIGTITDKLSGMNKEQLESIANWGLFAISTGGVLKVIGGLTSGIGSILGVASKLSGVLGTATVATESVASAGSVAGGAGGLGALATGLGGAVVAAAPYIAIAGAVALAGYGIYKGLTQEVVPSVDLFADKVTYASETVQTEYGTMTQTVATGNIKIADSTKQAVASYMDMDTNAKGYLQDLYINGQTITDQIVTDSKTKFDDMKNSIVQGYETQKTDSLTKLQELFTEQNTITSTEQAEIIKKTTDFYTSKQTQTQTYEDQINAIIKTASDQKRTLTQQEVTDIGQLQNQMRENAVNSLSQNEVEAQVILQRMKDYDGRITAEQASEHIKKLNESRDGAVQSANDEYDKNIATITKMRDESGSITAEQADKMISEAKRQRDEVVQHAEDTRTNAVDKIKSMNTDIGNNVDTTTGKILTLWDKLKNWWNSWQPQSKTVEVHMPYDTNNNKSTMNNGTIWGTQENWTGNQSFSGGFTTLHERGFELYDLPNSTRVYNHDASEDLVLKTAESVATKVAKNMVQNSNGGSSQPIKIEVPVILDGKEIARVATPYISNNMAFNSSRKGW